MGGCFSCCRSSCCPCACCRPEDQDDSELKSKGKAKDAPAEKKGAPAPAAAAGPGKTVWREDQWQNDIRDVWGRPLDQLPCHMDLPRLGKNIKIYDSEGYLLPVPEGGKHEIVFSLLTALAETMHEPDALQARIRDEYYNFVSRDGTGDISQQLLKFLVAVVDNTNMAYVLKCCHQKIVFPGFYAIKTKIHEKIPFKDYRGTWEVSVRFTPDQGVFIEHTKEQIAVPPKKPPPGAPETDNEEFTFSWKLKLHLTPDLKTLDFVSVEILNFNIRSWVAPERQKEIISVVEQHFKIGAGLDTAPPKRASRLTLNAVVLPPGLTAAE